MGGGEGVAVKVSNNKIVPIIFIIDQHNYLTSMVLLLDSLNFFNFFDGDLKGLHLSLVWFELVIVASIC